MRLDDFSYDLPPSLIAQVPLKDRTASRLMAVERATGKWEHTAFARLPDFLEPDDCLVVNRSRVVPARLFVHRKTGARIEVLFVRKLGGARFTALMKPGGKVKEREVLAGEGGEYALRFIGKRNPREAILELESSLTIDDVLEKKGHTPLPPYIKRPDESADKARYQTVYADDNGSVAAPTAGLHFDAGMLGALRRNGVHVVSVVLHVGPGTFLPLEEEKVERNTLSSEAFELTGDAVASINAGRARGSRIVAVGTTVTRVLESAYERGLFDALAPGEIHRGDTDLFIYPGYRFRVVDALLTNFHLPQSSLLLLVATFLGKERILACYREAVKEKYRFYSYGDVMFIR